LFWLEYEGKTGFQADRTKHSEKPEEMRQMIMRVSYEPYLEVFGRKMIRGWDIIGDEIE